VSVAWLFPLLIAQRLFELWLSRRNARLLLARGGREFYARSFVGIALLHTLFLLALALEGYPWRIPAESATHLLLGTLFLLQCGRYWCIASLGAYWNARILLIPGATVRQEGPYRWLRHPNYLIVTCEFLYLPLLLGTPLTLLLFLPANLFVLRQRIRLEESALARQTDYAVHFPVSS